VGHPRAGRTRRDVLRLALAVPAASLLRVPVAAARRAPEAPRSPDLGLDAIRRAPGRVVSADGSELKTVTLTRDWDDGRCRARVKNTGASAAAVAEVVLFDVAHALPPQTPLYGEGFQMLSETGGTVGQPVDLGDYTDAKHYRMPQPADATVLYNLLALTAPKGGHRVLAFSSSRRYVGRFELRPASLRIVVDTEGRALGPGEQWDLEEFVFLSGPDREALLAAVGDRIAAHHPPLRVAAPPSGWCSWYCFGPKVTAEDVRRNLDVIARDTPGLRYIQVDDGYQPAMGDWLETGAAFGGNVQGVLKEIRARGFEPAIWVAPFVAEKDSNVFKAHPDWFVTGADGRPLRSDLVTFGGWRRGPWYALDGTHPEAQAHLESVFRTMRTEWGCTYFKLDANFWGAIHGGRFHDPRATRVEAYRRGMEAVRRGAGDAFILGCNHPLWPSLGLVHGSRSSNDIKRTWARVKGTARQNLLRNWQNGRLVERPRRRRPDRAAGRRGAFPLHRRLRHGRDDPLRRRSHEGGAAHAGPGAQAAASDGKGRAIPGRRARRGHRRSRRWPRGLPAQLGGRSPDTVLLARAPTARARALERRGPRTPVRRRRHADPAPAFRPCPDVHARLIPVPCKEVRW
jgi:alpha-galactosidase